MPLADNERLAIVPNRSGSQGWTQTEFEAEVQAAGGGGGGGGISEFGELLVTGNVAAQATSALRTTFTQWNNEGLSSAGIAPSAANDNMNVTPGGIYEINAVFCYQSASPETQFTFEFVHDLNQIGPTFTDIKNLSTAEVSGAFQVVSLSALWTLNDNDRCGIWVSSDGPATIVVQEGRFTIKRLTDAP